MWGSPGTMLASLFMHRRTGQPRFADLFRETARALRSAAALVRGVPLRLLDAGPVRRVLDVPGCGAWLRGHRVGPRAGTRPARAGDVGRLDAPHRPHGPRDGRVGWAAGELARVAHRAGAREAGPVLPWGARVRDLPGRQPGHRPRRTCCLPAARPPGAPARCARAATCATAPVATATRSSSCSGAPATTSGWSARVRSRCTASPRPTPRTPTSASGGTACGRGDIGLAIYLLDCIEATDRFPTLDVFDA